MYKLKTSADFDSAHFLYGYNGKCSNIHGHRWHVEVEIKRNELEESGQLRGMITDFGDLKKDLRELADYLDHALIYEKDTLRQKTVEALNEEGFRLIETDFRPTAENFSKYFYDEMVKKGYNVKCAVVYETPDNCAVYCDEE
jgi:6-pyruvoyltetrahydropterin/6-carboxytetrahydropterin synthase